MSPSGIALGHRVGTRAVACFAIAPIDIARRGTDRPLPQEIAGDPPPHIPKRWAPAIAAIR